MHDFVIVDRATLHSDRLAVVDDHLLDGGVGNRVATAGFVAIPTVPSSGRSDPVRTADRRFSSTSSWAARESPSRYRCPPVLTCEKGPLPCHSFPSHGPPGWAWPLPPTGTMPGGC